MSIIATLPSVSMEGGLSRYLAEIRKFPFLEASEEIAYAKRWRHHGDQAAAYHLVTSHLRLAAKIAMKYRRYGLPMADLVSEANLGLMYAVKRFNPDLGFRLATYAMWWIKACVQEFVLRSWSLVKMGTTAAQKKLFFNLSRLKNRISAFDEQDLRPDQVDYISKHLNVNPREVIEMNRRMSRDVSLNLPVNDEDTGGEWQDFLQAESDDPESLLAAREEYERRRAAISHAIQQLSERERAIIQGRFLTDNPKTLEELACEYHVSHERIRQIERRAIERAKSIVATLMASTPPSLLTDARMIPS